MIKLDKNMGRLKINLLAINMGKDICVLLAGGDTPHLGAITLGSNYEKGDTFSFGTHKEGIITKMFSKILQKNYSCNIAVCCGIHLENITKQEITDVYSLCTQLAEELSEQLTFRTLDTSEKD